MTRNIFIFLGTFVAGALIALVARAALFNPHGEHEAPAEHTAHASAKPDHAPMVSNALVPASGSTAAPVPEATSATNKPVNTVCAICGMAVDPSLPTLEYKGKQIGFGCRMCAPKFKAAPDRYGPAYLRNEVIKK